MTLRKSFALLAACLLTVSFASTASALPRCLDVCTITCPCETPCVMFGTMVTTCADWACDNSGGSFSLMSVEDFPILDYMDEASYGSDIDVAAETVEETPAPDTAS